MLSKYTKNSRSKPWTLFGADCLPSRTTATGFRNRIAKTVGQSVLETLNVMAYGTEDALEAKLPVHADALDASFMIISYLLTASEIPFKSS